MKNFSALRQDCAKALLALVGAGLVAVSPHASSAKPDATTAPARPASAAPPPPSPAAAATAQPSQEERRAQWQRDIAKLALPRKGCFSASYPAQQWREIACGVPSKYPNNPATAPLPNNAGGGNTIHVVSQGLIASATGSFDSVTPPTLTASGPVPFQPAGTIASDAFSLQINSEAFDTPACNGIAGCKGWQQFIYSRYQHHPNPSIFIEYWLRGFGPTCPAGWTSAGSGGDCYRNSPFAPAPAITAADLAQATLTGKAAGGPGGTDEIRLITAGGTATAATSTNHLQLNQVWNTVEWNVVGDCCNHRVDFSPATAIVARVTLNDGTQVAPECLVPGISTGESNNLNFGPTAPARSGVGPALIFMESDPGGSLATNCAASTSFGDTHLSTFNGLLYDFQARGDFVLAQVGADFVVQARQVLWGSNSPDVSVNSAVALRMGKTQVAVCLAPPRLLVDGKATDLGDDKVLALKDGVVISRRGNAYLIKGPDGHSVRTEVNSSYLNVAVGLGRWPVKVVGLLANAPGDVNSIAARDGSVLTSPFPFDDLYRRYADSWRVGPQASLLSACGDKELESGIPRKPFYANDLEAKVHERARAVCVAAGVKGAALLDACTLDVAVIGDDAAARVFVAMTEPVAVATVLAPAGDGAEWRPLQWLLWLALIGFVLWALLRLKRRTSP